ncbi:MAG: hypothetical protein ABS76_34280 [Pelagibacterium sp. SCN 64-44]|nr:MAG: hypothetical protein ABS76_34280 [Pelagibacterium sp. SCN 64-44]
MNRPFIAAFAVLSMLLAASPAVAHSNVVSAVPAEQTEVSAPPAIEMTFNETVNLGFSTLNLIGPDGQDIPLGEATSIADGKGMAASVDAELSPGTYTVNWTLLSPDGHKLEGSYSFTVSP